MRIFIYSAFFLVMLSTKVYTQPTFEFLYSLPDTSISGLNIYEDEIGNTYCLSVVSEFVSLDGVLIEGPVRFGSGITKVKPNGTIGTHHFYQTGKIPNGLLERGFIPTAQLLLQDERIILPYTPFSGYLPTTPSPVISLGYSFKRKIKEIDKFSGETIGTYAHDFDSLVGHHFIRGIYPMDDDGVRMVYYDQWSRLYIIQTMNEDLEIMQLDTVDTEGKLLELDPYTEEKIIYNRDSILIYDLDGNLERANHFGEIMAFISFYNTRLTFHPDYIAVKFSGYTDTDERGSAIIVYDRFGNQLSYRVFSDMFMEDFAITEDGEILALFNLSQVDIYDSIPKPFQVSLFDINMDLLATKNYGFPYLDRGQIKAFSNNQFGVVGVQLTEVLDTEDEAPSSLYVLRESITDLDLVTNLKELEKEKVIIYPNPVNTNEVLNIATEIKNYSITIYNTLGQVVMFEKNLSGLSSVSLEKMVSGLHVIEINNSDGQTVFTEKMVIH